MRSILTFLVSGILVSGLAVRPLDAATSRASIIVSAEVQTSCLVSTTATSYTTFASAADASAVSVVCSNSTPYNVRLSAGLPRGATKVLDEMTVHGAPLVDHLLSSNPRSIGSWRQALGENTGAASGASSTLVLAIQGRTAAGQPAPAGAYSDVVTVVVTY